MKTWPMVVRIERSSMSNPIRGCRLLKSNATFNWPDIVAQVNESMVTHLLMCSNIYKGLGLNYDLIDAWKSGRNPSATSEIINSITPKGSVALSLCFQFPPKLYKIIPDDIRQAMIIFLGPKANFLSLTLEQNTPTNTTDIILQDFTSITIGKLVKYIATIYV